MARDAMYGYNNLGNVTSVQYPFGNWSNGTVSTAGPQYNYSYDAMNRLTGMTGPNNQTLVSSVSYGPANRMMQLNAASFTETRSYNADLQLVELASGSTVHLKYNYSATQNNGRIQSQTDVVSGETVAYTYDTLNRLTQASGTGDPSGSWSQAFSYDGFGNLVGKTGSNAPNNAFLNTNPANNRLSAGGAQYDANGNLTAYGTGSSLAKYTYDIENRLYTSTPVPGATQLGYAYDSSNQRVYQGSTNSTNQNLYFYGIDGAKLGVWSLQVSGSTVTLSNSTVNVWFAGRLLTPEDRLQSRGKYFPYGEDRYSPSPANPANDQDKFATYTRDSTTGLDYANQRYYNAQLGRFHTADPYGASATPEAPQSWNRYGYTIDDPISGFDPTGLDCVYASDGNGNFVTKCTYTGGPIGGAGVGGGGGFGVGVPRPNKPFPTEGGLGPGPRIYSPRVMLTLKLQSLGPNCKKVLPSLKQLSADADKLTFWDARAQGAVLASAIPGVHPSRPGATLSTEVGAAIATTLGSFREHFVRGSSRSAVLFAKHVSAVYNRAA